MTAPATLPRLLAGTLPDRALSLAEHLELHGPMPELGRRSGRSLIELVDEAGLAGRGGARFPTARKMAAVAAGRRPIVVANGTEGEPLAAKDRLLLGASPHLVIDGCVLAAQAVGAREALICVANDAPAAHRAVELALEERRRAHRDPIDVRLVLTAEGFVPGEATALVNQLNGGPAKPTFSQVRVEQRGVRRRPTLVDNVETLAHVALIARHGARWFRAIGTPREPGSMLVTVVGAVAEPRVYEAAQGTPIADLFAAAGGLTAELRAVLVGGYFGSWIDGELALQLPLANEQLSAHDAALGAGVLVALPTSACGAAELARTAVYLAGESAGQCGPCVHGLAAISATIVELVEGRASADAPERLRRWIGQVSGRGACRFPDGAMRFIATGLSVFAGELAEHARHGACEACWQESVCACA